MCPSECQSISYLISTSQSDYPSYSEYLNLLKNKQLVDLFPNGDATTIAEFKQSLYTLYVSFDDLKYMHISEQPKVALWDLISNVGGLFGLFLGLSFLSFIDFIQVLLEILLIMFEKK